MSHPRRGFAAAPGPAKPDPRRLLGGLVACALFGPAAVAGAAPPHQHGIARLDAAIEGPALTVALSVPLDSLLGFERAPRTVAEQQAAAHLVERLKRAGDAVQPDPAAQCESTDVTLVSGALGLGAATAATDADEDHADLDATYSFRCRAPGKLGFIDLPLMKTFPRIGRIEAQVVGGKGQGRQVVKRPATRLAWPGP